MTIFNLQFTILKKKSGSQRAFTLVELIIAIGLFTVIATFSLGALLSIYGANKEAQFSKTVTDNLNLALENMVRTVRFGGSYHCGSAGSLSNPRDCHLGDNFLAVTFEGNLIIYRLSGGSIQRSNDGGSTYKSITSADTSVDYLKFYVFNSSDSDNNQPYVVAVFHGYVGNKPTNRSMFSIQTLMSQRTLDI